MEPGMNCDLEVLMVIEGDIATTQLLERVLQACRPLGIAYSKAYLSQLTFGELRSGKLPLFVRCGDPELVVWIDLLRRAGQPYLYYIDDNFWEIHGDTPLARHYQDPRIRHSLEYAVTHAQLVLTNSDILTSFLRRFTSRLRTLPPFFDFDLIEHCVPESTHELRIGFAGSSTRGGDLELVRPIIQPVLDQVPNAVFEFAGVLPSGIQPGDRIRFFEHTTSYADYIRFQASRNWAIGLAPLLDSIANRAKTNNKYREYGACRIAGIYSDMPPYLGCVDHRSTGLLVGPDPQDWLASILELARNAELRGELGVGAEKDVRSRFCVKGVAAEWGDCLRSIRDLYPHRPVRWMRAYLGGILARRIAYTIYVLWLQVKDAYSKGGFPMVTKKTVQRIGSLLYRG